MVHLYYVFIGCLVSLFVIIRSNMMIFPLFTSCTGVIVEGSPLCIFYTVVFLNSIDQSPFLLLCAVCMISEFLSLIIHLCSMMEVFLKCLEGILMLMQCTICLGLLMLCLLCTQICVRLFVSIIEFLCVYSKICIKRNFY